MHKVATCLREQAGAINACMDNAQVSHTAWLVFACHLRLKQMKRWASLVDDQDVLFYQRCYAFCRQHFTRYTYLHYLLPLRPCIWLVNKALAFGAPQHFVLRKRAIAAQLQAAIEGGAKQVVFIGGGFDPAAFRQAMRYPDVRFFEVDMPAMHGYKTQLVDAHIASRPANLSFISADLASQSLEQVMRAQPGFDSHLPTLFIAEGVLMYLSEADVTRLLSGLRALCAADITFVFTAIEARHEKKAAQEKQMRDAILKASKERFGWSMDEGHMAQFLAQQGWKQKLSTSYAQLQAPYRDAAEMKKLEQQNGEYIVVATQGRAS